MRFSTSAVLALPLLAAAAESQFDQYKAQFQNFLGNFGSYLPNPSKHDHAHAAETKGEKKMDILTLENWKEKLYAPVQASQTKPEEFWVFFTGGNKTCFGHCGTVEAAFNETAVKFSTMPKAPHMAYVNCEDQPILCNSWAASTATIWAFEMRPPPAKTDIYIKRLNMTSTTSQTILDLYAQDSKEAAGFKLYEGYFHPLDGPLAQNGLAVPVGYVLWAFNLVPSWMMMITVSMLSRTMMSRRMGPQPGAGGPATAGGRAYAPPGDAR